MKSDKGYAPIHDLKRLFQDVLRPADSPVDRHLKCMAPHVLAFQRRLRYAKNDQIIRRLCRHDCGFGIRQTGHAIQDYET